MTGALVSMGALALWPGSTTAAPPLRPSPERVAQIAATLAAEPAAVDLPTNGPLTWRSLAATPDGRQIIAQAADLSGEPIPATPRQLYLDFSRTGDRDSYQRPYFAKRRRLVLLVLAERLENQGRFLPAIEAVMADICAEPTWCLPAHDPGLEALDGRRQILDLFVAETAWDLATARGWLGDRLSPKLRDTVRDEIDRRALEPFDRLLEAEQPAEGWPTATHNWNAVCHAGIVGAALASAESKARRARFLAAAERNLQHFLDGFGDDGYCSEGLGYWNYGFGHYLMLSLAAQRASGGALDWLATDRARTIAEYAWRIEIAGGVYPAFADAEPGVRPSPLVQNVLGRRFGWPIDRPEPSLLEYVESERPHLYGVGTLLPATVGDRGEAAPRAEKLRDAFTASGVFVLRPGPTEKSGIAVALKGGHNAEHHNHNDVGSYVVVRNGAAVLVDPGSEVYTSRTFGPRRYESDLLNSFGHGVPRIDGQLQRTGAEAAATVADVEFTDQRDAVTLDIGAAYDVPGLELLTRQVELDRPRGIVTIRDEVVCSRPVAFETAVVTFEPWQKTGDATIRVGQGDEALDVRIETPLEFVVEATTIDERARAGRQAERIAVRLAEPTQRATVRLVISAPPTGDQ